KLTREQRHGRICGEETLGRHPPGIGIFKMRLIVIWAAVVVAGTGVSAGAEETRPAPASPELKVLDRVAGTWDTEASFRSFGEKPRDETFKGVTTIEWPLGGRFLQSRGSHPGRLEDLQMMTYDPIKKVYRHWYFSSEGVAEQSAGQWDDKKLTMT